MLYEYLITSQYEGADFKPMETRQPSLNSELTLTLSEVLQSRNEERRLPKCAKGTRDMNPV
jgi:hypothetical protein